MSQMLPQTVSRCTVKAELPRLDPVMDMQRKWANDNQAEDWMINWTSRTMIAQQVGQAAFTPHEKHPAKPHNWPAGNWIDYVVILRR